MELMMEARRGSQVMMNSPGLVHEHALWDVEPRVVDVMHGR